MQSLLCVDTAFSVRLPGRFLDKLEMTKTSIG